MRRRKSWRGLCFSLAAVAGLGASCGGGGDAGPDPCERGAARLRECGLLSAGTTRCEVPQAEREEADCTADCLGATECETLSILTCTDQVPTSPDAVRLSECITRCAEQFGFQCAAAGHVPLDFVCDGEADCSDASDEAGCAQFDCGSGEQVPQVWFCDGLPDCSDSSDEGAGCEHFTCGDGSLVPLSFQCDGFDDCGDGSDEAGCDVATTQCQ